MPGPPRDGVAQLHDSGRHTRDGALGRIRHRRLMRVDGQAQLEALLRERRDVRDEFDPGEPDLISEKLPVLGHDAAAADHRAVAGAVHYGGGRELTRDQHQIGRIAHTHTA